MNRKRSPVIWDENQPELTRRSFLTYNLCYSPEGVEETSVWIMSAHFSKGVIGDLPSRHEIEKLERIAERVRPFHALYIWLEDVRLDIE